MTILKLSFTNWNQELRTGLSTVSTLGQWLWNCTRGKRHALRFLTNDRWQGFISDLYSAKCIKPLLTAWTYEYYIISNEPIWTGSLRLWYHYIKYIHAIIHYNTKYLFSRSLTCLAMSSSTQVKPHKSDLSFQPLSTIEHPYLNTYIHGLIHHNSV